MAVILRRTAGLLICLALLVNICGLQAAEAGLIGTKDEVSIGRNVANQLEKKYGVVDDPALQERVAKIGARIVSVCDRKDITYSFKVLNSKEVNALAAPGGFVYIFKGLVDLMPSDDELAGIIGHEVAHISRRHTVRQIEKSLGMSILFGVAFGDRGQLLQNLAFNAIMAGYSRTDEREADRLGFYHSFRAGYNPYSMLMGLRKLSEMDQKYHYDLFSDHPEAKSRVALVQGCMNENKILPQVKVQGKSAQVFDGDWVLPPLYATVGGYKPEYRAYFVAGRVWQVRQVPNLSVDKFILDSDGTNYTIYYEDKAIITLTPEDATPNGVSTQELAGMYIEKLKEQTGPRNPAGQ